MTYDETDRASILRFGRKLKGKTLRHFIPNCDLSRYQTGKGQLGDIVEQEYFGINPGNDSRPDFPEAELELKTTPVRQLKKGGIYSAKERLSLQMINYEKLPEETWETSSFLQKNRNLLVIYYLWEEKVESPLDYKIFDVKLWEWNEADIHVIRADWERARQMVSEHKAHDLSEKLFTYLSPCKKSEKGTDTRSQYKGIGPPAPRRAWSLKGGYMTAILRAEKLESIVPADCIEESEDIENYIASLFQPYIGKLVDDIAGRFSISNEKKPKNYHANIVRHILKDVAIPNVAEFVKAEIITKTIRLDKNGTPKESVSFPAFDHNELVLQHWEDSELRATFSRRFLFVVFAPDSVGRLRLKGTAYWSMPEADLDKDARICFEETKRRVLAGGADKLPAIKENRKLGNDVCHVRPHALKKKDGRSAPRGTYAVKQCFWLNQLYLKKVLTSLF